MISNISCVILAGGASSRFNGVIKSNILIGGKTIISRIAEIVSDIFSEIIIVTNTPEQFEDYTNFKITGDQFLNAGPLGGIHAGLNASSKEAVFVFAGDMPLLDKGIIIRQIEYFKSCKCEILLPRISAFIEPLHSICNSSVKVKLENYLKSKHEKAVRDFFKQSDVRYMELEDTPAVRNIFTNINSPSDISLAEKIFGTDRSE
jgi:molybdopterin-guanine dinucleotide biosynthesis protein A